MSHLWPGLVGDRIRGEDALVDQPSHQPDVTLILEERRCVAARSIEERLARVLEVAQRLGVAGLRQRANRE